jgi:hypothetical protein
VTDGPPIRLQEYDTDEWRRVARLLHPDWSDEEIDRAWDEFQEMRRRKLPH